MMAGNVSLQDFKGKRLLLYFYPKASTPGCTIEACEFRDLKPKFDEQDTVVIGVSADPEKALKNFKLKQRLNFPLLGDPTHKMIKSYGVSHEKIHGPLFQRHRSQHVSDCTRRKN